MMKYLIATVLLCFFFSKIPAQTMEVHYTVTTPKEMPLDDGKIKIYMLEYEGLIYQSGTKVINWLAPTYLMDYPTGNITMKTESGYSIMTLNMDSMQNVILYRTDSLRYWHYDHSAKQYFTTKYKPKATKWKLLPETKTINGLLCHHAVTYTGNAIDVLYDIWYYPDVIMEYSLLGIRDAPGLVVEGSCPMRNMTYSLKYFKTGEPVNDAVFWPAIFNKVKFEDWNKLKEISAKDKKKADIMSQQ